MEEAGFGSELKGSEGWRQRERVLQEGTLPPSPSTLEELLEAAEQSTTLGYAGTERNCSSQPPDPELGPELTILLYSMINVNACSKYFIRLSPSPLNRELDA